jgi:hypothetical protein
LFALMERVLDSLQVEDTSQMAARRLTNSGVLQKLLGAGDIDGCCFYLRDILSSQPDTIPLLRPLDTRLVGEIVREGATKDAAPAVGSLVVLANVATMQGQWRHAVRLFDRMIAAGRSPSGAAVAQVLTPQNASSVSAWASHRGVAFDTVMGLKVLGESGSWTAALQLARDAERRSPHAEMYSSAVLVPYLAAGGQWEEAIRLLNNGVASGAMVDTALVSHMLTATAQPATWRSCLALAAQLSRYRMMDDVRDPAVYAALMRVCPAWGPALQVFGLVRAVGVAPPSSLIGGVMAHCEAAHRWDMALRLYQCAAADGYVGAVGTDSYDALISSFHASAQWDSALRALSWMSGAGVAASTAGHVTLIELCERAGQWAAAATLGTAMIAGGHAVTAATYGSVIGALAAGGQWPAAMRGFVTMRDDARVKAAHSQSACSVLQACLTRDRWVEALRFFASVHDSEPRVVIAADAFSLAVKASLVGQRWEHALHILVQQKRSGVSHSVPERQAGVFAAAARGMWRSSLHFYSTIPPPQRTARDAEALQSLTVLAANPAQRRAIEMALRQSKPQKPQQHAETSN